MRTTYDGFAIAERDLALRGPGDFLPSSESTRQSGDLPINLAGIEGACAMKLLDAAFSDAREIMSDDPTLSKPEHEPLAAITAPIEELSVQYHKYCPHINTINHTAAIAQTE